MTPCSNCKHSFRETLPMSGEHQLICFHQLAEKMGSDSRHARLDFCEASDCFEKKEGAK